ncbi:MAG: Holliday junction resolvase RuvX [Chromatiales bacterium]|nr:Holliday junction resolvase RuvX [Chromatiales bacterium]
MPEARRAAPATVNTILAFDFGTRRIGLALGTRVGAVSRPLAVVRANPRIDWSAIARAIDDWRPELLVVGLPLDRDGGEQAATVGARRFARQLAGRHGLPVEMIDERYTSVEAESRHPAVALDAAAAALIAEDWLHSR